MLLYRIKHHSIVAQTTESKGPVTVPRKNRFSYVGSHEAPFCQTLSMLFEEFQQIYLLPTKD